MMAAYDGLDEALGSVATAGPDLRNGLTNHAPMAIEALCAMGRGDAVMPWLERYRAELLPWPALNEPIERERWQGALGEPRRATDWLAFFRDELEEAPWQMVLDRWAGRLAPGICASATHGVIRVGHAARSLVLAESPVRIEELAAGLASWTSTYQTLPTNLLATAQSMRPREAILRVEVVPPAQRQFTGTITSSLEALGEFAPFAPVIGLADLDGDPAATISELTEAFVDVYLGNARDFLNTIVFVHGVTSIAALRSILPHLGAQAAIDSLRYAWQASCGLYAAFAERPTPQGIQPPRESPEELIDMAVSNGDEHAIKFTEVCLGEHRRGGRPAFLAAARHAIGALKA